MKRAGSRRGAKATQDFREQTEGLYIQHRYQQNVMRQILTLRRPALGPSSAEPKCPHSTMEQEIRQPLKGARLTGMGAHGIFVTLVDKPYWHPVLDNDKVSHFTFRSTEFSALTMMTTLVSQVGGRLTGKMLQHLHFQN